MKLPGRQQVRETVARCVAVAASAARWVSTLVSACCSFIAACAIRLAHHLPAAVLVASIILILHEHGLLDRVTAATQSAAAEIVSTRRASEAPIDPIRSAYLSIDQRAYERTFGQSSPLDRRALATILEELCKLDRPPAIVAIDLDLSPAGPAATDDPREAGADTAAAGGERCGDAAGSSDAGTDAAATAGERCDHAESADAELECTLMKLADEVEVVLILPQPVRTDAAVRAKAEWVRRLNEHERIRFGLAHVFSHDGTVLRYLHAPSTFAAAICRSAANAKDVGCDVALEHAPDVRSARGTLLSSFDPVNDLGEAAPRTHAHDEAVSASLAPRDGSVESSDRLGKVLNIDWLDAAWAWEQDHLENEHLRAFNYKFLPPISDDDRIVVDRFLDDPEAFGDTLAGRLVLLAGDYGGTDLYAYAGGELTGSEVHLGAFYSMFRSVKEEHGWKTFVSEIVGGVVLGVLLSAIAVVKPYTGTVIAHGAVMLGVAYAFLRISIWLLLERNVWLDPAPLLFGMVLHRLLIDETPAAAVFGSGHPVARAASAWILRSLFAATVVWAVWILSHH